MAMAMAASMRVGGGALLRRTPVAEARRRLAHTTAEEMREVATRAAQIDKTKEELFDMVIDLNSNYNVPHSMKREHLLLSQRLSSQIQPRSYDPAWRFCRRTERRNTFYKFVGVTTCGLVGSAGLFLLLHGPHHRPKKWVVDWWDKLTS